jgi:type IV fimbrial biogenesis protein FimT
MLMNTHRTASRCSAGFTLIELLVTLTLMALLLASAMPAMSSWAADARLRSVAEQLQNSLRLAQSEAIRRNRQTVLALTNATPALDAAPSTDGQRWFVRSLPLLAGEAASDADYIQDSSSARQSSVTLSGAALICFNSMGRQTSNSATGLGASCSAPLDASTPSRYTLRANGASHDLQLQVYLGGQVRLCNPSRSLSDTNPDGC